MKNTNLTLKNNQGKYIPQEWEARSAEFIALRCETGVKFLSNIIRSMFKQYSSSSGRWDLEGIKVEITAIKGRRDLLEQEAIIVARLSAMQV